jgi:hypothetical protein
VSSAASLFLSTQYFFQINGSTAPQYFTRGPRDKSSLNLTSQIGEAEKPAGVEWRRLQEAYGEVRDAIQR